MKFVTYIDPAHSKTTETIGIIDSAAGKIISISAALSFVGSKFNGSPSYDMLDLIKNYDVLKRDLDQIWVAYKENRIPSQDEKNLTLLSPIPRPVSVRDGYAFRQHVEASRKNRGLPMIPEFDQFPIFYFTNHLAIIGGGDVPVQPLAQQKLDYELEVAIVIGKEGKNIPASKADDYIFGYMIMNDWSARALQMEEMKLNLGPAKGKDFATSLGPYLVTRDELSSYGKHSPQGERHHLKMEAFINGKKLSEGNLDQMNWTFAQIIERASYGVTLRPGEVIGSGTVGTGCLMELNGSKVTDNLWLKPGDEVILEVEALGQLKNRIVAAEAV